MAISTAKTQPKNFVLKFSDRVNIPDWLLYTLVVANYIFVLLFKDPFLDAVTITVTVAFMVAMAIRSIFNRVMFGRRQLRLLRAVGTVIASTISSPLAWMAAEPDGGGCQSAGFLSGVSNFAYNALRATPFLASWMCDQIAIIVVLGLVALSLCVIWIGVDSLMTQQPLTVYIKPMLSIMLIVSLVTGLAALLTYAGTATNPATI